jgi:hypothetical protein
MKNNSIWTRLCNHHLLLLESSLQVAYAYMKVTPHLKIFPLKEFQIYLLFTVWWINYVLRSVASVHIVTLSLQIKYVYVLITS